MLDWIKNINKEYPEFWKNYLSKFEAKSKSKRVVIFSVEKSGNIPGKDVIYSLSSVAVEQDNIVINDCFEVLLLQYVYLHDNGLSNEFIIESKQKKLSEPAAIEAFIDYIGSATLVGYRIDYDIEMINQALEKMHCGRLKNEALDIEIMFKKWKDNSDKSFTLDELCTAFKIPTNEIKTASEDAYNGALLFLKLKSRLGIR
jgi:DNA polymerase-3 subunit epsilon